MARATRTDFYDFDSLLTEEEIAIRDAVGDWVDERFLPLVEKAYDDAYFPTEVIPELAEMGLFGATLPEKYGCAGVGPVAYGLTMQELERGDSGLRSFASVQGALCMYPIFEYGSEEQRTKWLPRMAKGEVIGCFGLTEPDFGSDPGGMITRAKKVDGGYVLNGAKMWITNGTVADLAIVWAKLFDEAKGRESIAGFLVEKGTKGYSAPEQKRKHSLRASVTSELVLQDVFVPEGNRLPEGNGLKAPLGCLTQARFGIAFGVVGAAMACFESSVAYSKNRVMFGKPIGGFQLVQAELAKMHTEIIKAQLLALQCGRMKERGVCKPEHVSMAKRNNCEIALEIARRARDIHGANGITSEYPIMRHMNNLESVKTYEGTHNIHTLVLGENITGIAAYRG
ncbi:MAG: acyl-CoA dehydrogenase family protein [Candidatus Eisenbacteria bacterium]|uniref:Acyl-CoA dehydrogenase family protein n=1 Tax=Eiseniibacteriota bacterium TaxID=2212470 RepID=A0A933S9F6_UNCEI|nr:acyl-CoA dehydrogenase family protein [Candidatus Eisenbacteria bacterium]